MAQSLTLESFEDVLADPAGPSPDYNRGYEDGLAAGTAAAQAEAAGLSESCVQALSDIDFTYAEARGQVLAALAPLFSAVIEQILPHCVEAGFAGQVAETLLQAAKSDTNAPIKLHLHPDYAEAVKSATAELSNRITVVSDPAQDLHAAWIQTGDHETRLDVGALLVQIGEILSALDDTQQRNDLHG